MVVTDIRTFITFAGAVEITDETLRTFVRAPVSSDDALQAFKTIVISDEGAHVSLNDSVTDLDGTFSRDKRTFIACNTTLIDLATEDVSLEST